MVTLDHLILKVNDRDASVRFYTEVMGFGTRARTGRSRSSASARTPPSSSRRWGTEGGEHLAFALSPEEFEATFERVRAAGVPFGDSYHDVGNMRGPGEEIGAHGRGPDRVPLRSQPAPGRVPPLLTHLGRSSPGRSLVDPGTHGDVLRDYPPAR